MMLRPMLSMLLMAMTAVSAAAQPASEPVRNQISGAAQWALPYPGGGSTPGVMLSWRRWISPYLGIGTDARWWRRRSVTEFNSPAQDGPSGVIPAFQGRDERKIVSLGFGVGALARGSIGRLSLVGGVGPGFYIDRSAHESRINDRHQARSDTQLSLGVQGLAELEVRVTSRLSGFAGLRIELRDVRYPDSTSGYPTAGVRFAF